MVDCNNSSNLSFVSNSSGYYYLYVFDKNNKPNCKWHHIYRYITIDFGRPNRIRKLRFDIITCIFIYILLFLGLHLIWQIFFEVEPLKAYFVAQFYLRAFWRGEKSTWIPFWCFFDTMIVWHQTLNQQSCVIYIWSAKH